MAGNLARLALEVAADRPTGGYVQFNPPEEAREHATVLEIFKWQEVVQWQVCITQERINIREVDARGWSGERCAISGVHGLR